MIEAQELNYPDRDYQVKSLDMPEPILQEKVQIGSRASPGQTPDQTPPIRTTWSSVRGEEITTTGTG